MAKKSSWNFGGTFLLLVVLLVAFSIETTLASPLELLQLAEWRREMITVCSSDSVKAPISMSPSSAPLASPLSSPTFLSSWSSILSSGRVRKSRKKTGRKACKHS